MAVSKTMGNWGINKATCLLLEWKTWSWTVAMHPYPQLFSRALLQCSSVNIWMWTFCNACVCVCTHVKVVCVCVYACFSVSLIIQCKDFFVCFRALCYFCLLVCLDPKFSLVAFLNVTMPMKRMRIRKLSLEWTVSCMKFMLTVIW